MLDYVTAVLLQALRDQSDVSLPQDGPLSLSSPLLFPLLSALAQQIFIWFLQMSPFSHETEANSCLIPTQTHYCYCAVCVPFLSPTQLSGSEDEVPVSLLPLGLSAHTVVPGMVHIQKKFPCYLMRIQSL